MTDNKSISVAFDSVWREKLKTQLVELIRKRHPAIDRGIQFEDVTLHSTDDKGLAIILVLQDILREHREFCVVQWPGGIALVRTAAVDRLNKDYQQVNEQANFIIRGGNNEKLADLTEQAATPVSGPKE